ncbi:MAG: hypothetical protein JW731_07625 [Bacteroidales bacterium]|nr:hypothetical protein [Bacteroidales bacterium]
MKRKIYFVIVIVLLSGHLFSQVTTNKIVGNKNQALKDSLSNQEYPYALPIWGKKLTAAGFQLPYSAGLSVNYFWQESDLIISDLSVGFNNGPMYDLTEVIRFDDAISTANALNFRPDFWLFPFLNVYGIFGKAKTSTAITAGLWLPDSENNWGEVTTFSTEAKFDATSLGFGLTPTIGVGGGFLALDMNTVWTDVSALDKPVFTFVFGPRLGKSFKFKKPDMNITTWIGGFRVNFSSETAGSINLSDIFQTDELQSKVDQGLTKVSETAVAVDDWWNSLTPVEQKNPANVAKYETANRVLETAGGLLTSMDAALNDDQSASVQYSLIKKPKDMWNFLIGTQFQINRHFMIRAEYGFLSSRQQFTGGLQYRFGL